MSVFFPFHANIFSPLCLGGGRGESFDESFPTCALFFFLFFFVEVEITSHEPVPQCRLGLVHSDSASRDDTVDVSTLCTLSTMSVTVRHNAHRCTLPFSLRHVTSHQAAHDRLFRFRTTGFCKDRHLSHLTYSMASPEQVCVNATA